MKKVYVLCSLLLSFCVSFVNAQTLTISSTNPFTGGSTNTPLPSGTKYARSIYHYPASFFSANNNLPYGAILSAIAFERSTSTGTYSNVGAGSVFKIYLSNAPATSLDLGPDDITWANVINSATPVFNSDPSPILGVTPGFKTFAFGTGTGTSSAFTYTGGALIIYVESSLTTNASPVMGWNTNVGSAMTTPGPIAWTGNSIKGGGSSSSLPATLSYGLLDARMPHTQFVYTNPACSGTPVAGTTTSSTSVDICTGAPVTIELTGNSYGAGQMYQLQSSATSNGTYTNVGSSLSVPSSTFPVSTTMWYRYAVTCGNQTSYATPVKVTVPAPFPGGTYTIDKSQPTGGTNFNTFTEAAAAISCGTTGPIVFNVAPGATRYVEQFELPNIYTTSAINTITFNGNDDTIAFAGTVAAPHTVSLNGTDYVRFNNLHFIGTDATSALVMHLWNDANNNIFTNCTFSVVNNSTSMVQAPFIINASPNTLSNPSFGILGTGKNNILTGCETYGGYYGIALAGSTSANVTESEIINCDVRDFSNAGIYINLNKGVKVTNNNIEKPTRIATSSCQGILLNNSSGFISIERNRIHDLFKANPTATNTFYGLQFFASGTLGNENRVINNVVYNMESNGDVYGLYFSSTNYIQIYHNSISLDYTAATAGNAQGIYSAGTTGGIDISNNNISITKGGTGTKYCMYYSGGSGRRIADNNNFYINSPAGTNNVGYADLAARATLADWQNATGGLDMHSVTIDPAFTNAATGDLKPTALTLDNKGMGVNIKTDILGVPRDASVPDIGAYEFGTLPCGAVDTIYISDVKYDSASIVWRPVPGATSYEYIVDRTRTNPPGTLTATADTSHLATPLLAGTKYYVHVRTTCITGNISPWVVDSFTTPCIPVSTTVTASPSKEVCFGDTVTLNVQRTAGATYQWYKNGTAINGATDTLYKVGSTGSYELYVTTTDLCQDISANTAVRVNALPKPAITHNGNTLSTGTQVSYQWNKDGQSISGATSQSYTLTDRNATYTVTVTDSNGCAATSDGYNPSTSITAVQKEDISIYPNPAKDVLYINAPAATKVAIYSMDGKTLLQQDNTGSIDLKPLAAGVYTVKVTNTEGVVITIRKIVKATH